ncbi:hypothetical protein AK830_g10274 [Neonectria ditissima]|uniref:GH16 domain-containing protein n=1 Tax=Neonectria ditissima TaxID=78410 RepID=A0A0P7B430_9HYPO|nr:hypothetical protein AK830_g10274 [Neonectria ditissima]
MVPSLRFVGTAALACVGSASAKQWYLHDTYDATNFFDNFNFFSDADPNLGHVVYKTQEEATSLGLATCDDGEVYLGPDITNVLDKDTGRPSVRLHSKIEYNHGLFIARFSHLPESKCGAWPAFWTVGEPWPNAGEIDLIEGWNLASNNKPAFHTGDSDELGTCKIDGEGQTAVVDTDNCDNTYQNTPDQYLNEGCTVDDYDAPYGNSEGGVYALEWTDSFIKIFAWKWDSVPDNLDSDEPSTDSWGTPSLYLKNNQCNIDDHFVDQTLIINIAFCGNPVGNDDIWKQACSAKTSYDTCAEYVSAKPGDFENTYFKIKDIRYFRASKSKSTASESAAVSSTAAAISSSTVINTDATSTFATETLRLTNSSTIATATATQTGIETSITAGVEMTTSVVYTTSVSTVTACPASVTNCPVGSVVTETVALYTTVCPVSAEATSTGGSGSGSGTDSGSETITETVTNVHTVTSCAPEVTNCPVGAISTEYLTTTYCPGNGASTTPGSTTPGSGSGSGSGASETVIESQTSTGGFFPSPAPSESVSTPASYQTPSVVSTPDGNTSVPASTPSAISTPSSVDTPSSAFTPVVIIATSVASFVPTTGFAPVTTPIATPAASTSSSSSPSVSEVPVTGTAGKMSASLALIIGAAAAMMI